ncbi:MAG: SIMPL domain-containing protein [Acidobacteriota bacterium]|nr:SIMPL domain-containing protein [Acidobacteriota bacterium]
MSNEPQHSQSPAPERRASSNLLAWVVVTVVLAAAIAAGGVAFGRSRSTAPGTVTVTGSGTVMGTPDTLTVQLGVHTTAATALSALAQNNAKMAALTASLRHHGLAPKDMQTSGLNIYPMTNSNGDVTGFSVDNDLTVTIHHIKQAGGTIDAAANAVGNGIQLNGVTLSISNDSRLLAGARAKAMRNARTAAAQIASGGGTHLGPVVRIVDQENTNSYVYPIYGSASANGTALRAVPIQAGSQAVSVQVKVVFAL